MSEQKIVKNSIAVLLSKGEVLGEIAELLGVSAEEAGAIALDQKPMPKVVPAAYDWRCRRNGSWVNAGRYVWASLEKKDSYEQWKLWFREVAEKSTEREVSEEWQDCFMIDSVFTSTMDDLLYVGLDIPSTPELLDSVPGVEMYLRAYIKASVALYRWIVSKEPEVLISYRDSGEVGNHAFLDWFGLEMSCKVWGMSKLDDALHDFVGLDRVRLEELISESKERVEGSIERIRDSDYSVELDGMLTYTLDELIKDT